MTTLGRRTACRQVILHFPGFLAISIHQSGRYYIVVGLQESQCGLQLLQRFCIPKEAAPNRNLFKTYWKILFADSCHEKGVRYEGEEISIKQTKVDPNTDTQACVKLCDQHDNCQFWRHDSNDGECYLYASLTKKDNRTSYTSGRRSSSSKGI